VTAAKAGAAGLPRSIFASAAGERRQLTVMFCDLVGSTALSERLDPEELRELLRVYRQTCGDIVVRYDGHVAQYVGDGVTAHFGWPRAHEDEAGRAVRAALEIVRAVKQVSSVEPLHLRLGIATGSVVVGGTGEGGDNQLAVGETPNLASRLQALAGPDEIVIGPSTCRLIASAFQLIDLGEHALKGIGGPVRVSKAFGVRPILYTFSRDVGDSRPRELGVAGHARRDGSRGSFNAHGCAAWLI
jgi:class 3 adenylate cyclase